MGMPSAARVAVQLYVCDIGVVLSLFQINEFNHLDVIFPGLSTIYPQVL
jgi:hypothetical protein